MYIRRHMEDTVNKIARMFGAVLVTGPRQVGKTTLLHMVTEGMTYVTLDDPLLLQSAREEPGTFCRSVSLPAFIDEVQYAPNLFPHIKMSIDREKKKGQFFLSGSQQFKMMKNVGESLVGRIGILSLLGLSLREISGTRFDKPFIPTPGYFTERSRDLKKTTYRQIWQIIHRGSMPELHANPEIDWQMFYGAYTKSYIERDVRELTQVGDEVKFLKFITVMAASTGQLLNLASACRDIGISQPTAHRWLSILQTSNLVYLLQPYSNNLTKRAVKTPKVYFLDTGLAAYLTRWNTPDVMQNGAMAGAFFETFVIAEIIKSYFNAGVLEPPLFFYRDKEQNEIDLIISENGVLYPIEVKKYADPSRKDVEAFSVLDKISGVVRGPGGVICLYEDLVGLKDDDRVIPVTMI